MSATIVGRIEAAISTTDSALEACLTTKNAKQILSSLSTSSTILGNLIESLPKGGPGSGNVRLSRNLTPVKKSLVVLANAIAGLHTGVAERDLSLSEFRVSLKSVREKFVARASTALSGTVFEDPSSSDETPVPTGHPTKLTLSGDMKSAMAAVKAELNDLFQVQAAQADDENVVLREHKKSEQRYASQESKEEQVLKTRIEAVKALKGQLPMRLKHAYQVIRLPIVPIFSVAGKHGQGRPMMADPSGKSNLAKNFNSGFVLKALGISNIQVADYLILESQAVLAIDMKDAQEFMSDVTRQETSEHQKNIKAYREQVKSQKLREELASIKALKEEQEKRKASKKKTLLVKGAKPKRPATQKVSVDDPTFGNKLLDSGMLHHSGPSELERPKKVLTKVSPVDFAKTILEALNEKAPSKYVLVSDQFLPNPRNTHILFFWIMPQVTLTALLRKGWSKVLHWGFPW